MTLQGSVPRDHTPNFAKSTSYSDVASHPVTVKSPWSPILGDVETQISGPHLGTRVGDTGVYISRVDENAIVFYKVRVVWSQILFSASVMKCVVSERSVDVESFLHLWARQPGLCSFIRAAFVLIESALKATNTGSLFSCGVLNDDNRWHMGLLQSDTCKQARAKTHPYIPTTQSTATKGEKKGNIPN